MFKALRIHPVADFAGVALGAWRAKTRSVEWKHTLPVNIYLVNRMAARLRMNICAADSG